MKCESCVTLCQLRFFGATLAAARSVSLRQDDITPRRCEQQTDPMAGLLRPCVLRLGTKLVQVTAPFIRVAQLDFATTYKIAGIAKIRGNRTRDRMLWVGLWVEKSPRFCGNPHSHFQEIRSSVRIILRRRFGKPPAFQILCKSTYNDLGKCRVAV